MIADNEAIYDEQIFPLMAQIIEICDKHKIPMVASFQLTPESEDPDDERSAMLCTTTLPQEGQDPALSKANAALHNRSTGMMAAFTITRAEA